tara:strand:+ start:408 stop:602 length:195 start_codon:yes stop_codon:yes gene_type:complete
MPERIIEGSQLEKLRSDGVISDDEIAIQEGDIVLAKNVVNQNRRIIGKVSDILTENHKRRVLRD